MKIGEIKIYHDKNALFIIIAAILFLLLAAILIPRDSNVECKSDLDCVKQKLDCCGCNNGGMEICTSAKNASLIQANLSEKCNVPRICPAVYLCKETSCSCIQGKCTEVEKNTEFNAFDNSS